MKRIISILTVLLTMCTCAISASAYNWPEVTDWSALLREKHSMIFEDDFELYVEGKNEYAPYYGARLEPRSGVYFGVIPESYAGYSGASSYLTYFDMGSRQTRTYIANEINDNNVVVTVGWTVGNLDDVDYDVVRQGLDNLASFNKPMFIRFANEMNVSSIGDDPDRYIEIFRNVANMVHEYDNFAVVWSPNDLGSLTRPMQYYYPGDEYVDWIGVSSYMKKYFQGNPATTETDAAYFMTGDYAWHTNALKPVIKFMQDYGIQKPVMISEGGVSVWNDDDGPIMGWAIPRLRNMYWDVLMKYPQVKLINYFTIARHEAQVYYDDGDTTLAQIQNDAFNSGAYIKEYGQQPQFVYTRAEWSDELTADANGNVNLYTLAHLPSRAENTVTYYVDGNWYSNSAESPYICRLNISGMADGEHQLRILLNESDKEKHMSFYKSGNQIVFGEGRTINNVQKDIDIYVYGVKVDFDVQPCIINDRTMVPIRMFLNAIKFTDDQIIYDNGKITIDNKMRTIILNIGSDVAYIDGNPVQLDSPAVILEDRTLIPMRFVAENFGMSVDYNDYGSSMDIFLK